MALLVGIDEAGYGPHLGPLVVAAAGLDFPGGALPDPDLWGGLRACVRKRPAGASSRVVICDSKIAYGGPGDLSTLERTVLGFLAAAGSTPRSLGELLRATGVNSPAGRDAGDLPPRPWDRPEELALPLSANAEDIASAADRLARGLAHLRAAPGGLWLNAAPAARFNRLVDGQRNKAAALFALTADLLAEVQAHQPRDPIHVTMDRHGGRLYYGGLLSGAFPMTPVETVEESPAVSRYRLLRCPLSDPENGATSAAAPVHVTVRDRCETWSLPTALASMAAKYVRELHMVQLNAYFQGLVPGLRPTAGYGRDAWRFLSDVAAARAAAGVPDAAILRKR
jgi:hypothetical protein